MAYKLPRVEVFQGADGKFYFRKRNRNGKLTEPSQGYKQRRYAAAAARRDVPGIPVVHIHIRQAQLVEDEHAT